MLSRRAALLLGAPPALRAAAAKPRAILFTGRGRSGFLNPDRRLEIVGEDGRRLRALALAVPGDAGWGAYGFFRDGRALLQSLALPPDWKGKTFDEYYPRSRTRVWACNLETAGLEELCHLGRLSSFYSPCCLLPGEARIAVTAIVDGKSVLYTMDLDGSHARSVTAKDEFVYGVSLSPDGKRFAFHANYHIHVCNVDGTERREIAGAKGMLYFGTSWSPDGEWVLFQVCDGRQDPAHDWSAIAIAHPSGDGGTHFLTPPAAAWFGATYGAKDNPGGGSNQPQWAPDGSGVLYVRRVPGAKTPWEFQAGRKDTDHFNREFRPAAAKGGTHLALIDPRTDRETFLTRPQDGHWDFRASWSPDSRRICFLRAHTGGAPELWTMDARGGGAKPVTRGLRGAGAEHPWWIPGPAA